MKKIKYSIIIFLLGMIPISSSFIQAQQNENVVNGFIENLELVDKKINISVIDNLSVRTRALGTVQTCMFSSAG